MTKWKKRTSRKPKDEHTHLGLRIEDFKAQARAGINGYAHGPQYVWRDTDQEPLYEFETHLEIAATCTHPEERAGDAYSLTVYGDVSPESDIYRTLKDNQAVNEYNSPQYREYRGKRVPVYLPPKGMGMLDKERGLPQWNGTIWVQPRYVNDLLVMLGWNRLLYLSIHEKKIDRQRWIQAVSVQTSDPAEEEEPTGQDI